jgi:2-dehydropantoate 2-reductase
MNRDMLAGKRIELEWLTGKLIQLAEENGVPVPAHTLLYALIKARLAERDDTTSRHQTAAVSATG